MIRLRSNEPPDDPYDAAAWWSGRRRLRICSAREEEAFAQWLAEPGNAIAWEATNGPIETVGAFAAMPELRAMRESALAARAGASRPIWRSVGGGALAASVLAGLIMLGSPETFEPIMGPAKFAATPIQRYTTRIGERRTVRLADGSTVALNTASVLEIAYGSGRRDVRLLAGQALFKVAKDSTRPFVVAAGNRRITATGTVFDVQIGDTGTVTVLLVEGQVKVDPVKQQGFARIIPAIATEVLEPGEKLSAPAGVAVEIAATDVERGTSWTRGQLIFRDDPLVDAITEINRYSAVQLVIADPRVAAIRVSGVFDLETNENFVSALTAFYPIEARREAPGVTVLAWRGGGDEHRAGSHSSKK